MNDQSMRKRIIPSLALSRRRFLTGSAAVLAAPAIMSSRAAADSDSVVFISWGGSQQEIYNEVVLQPLAKKLGIKVINAYGPDLAKLKAQVMVGQVEWDLMSLTHAMASEASRDGLLEPIDYSIVENAEQLTVDTYEHYLTTDLYWGGIGYDPQRHGPGEFPTTWPEFWDVEGFPGRRGLRALVNAALENALLGDGVSPKELYPLDVDRGFRSLDRIKPHIRHWIQRTPETVSLIQNKEVDFDYIYKGRVAGAQAEGVSIEIADKQAIVNLTVQGVPKGARGKTNAMRLLNGILSPEMQAAFANALPGSGPVTKNSLPLVKPDILAQIPDVASPDVAVVDGEWWGVNYSTVAPRFKEWLLTD